MNILRAARACLHALYTPVQPEKHIRDLQKAYARELFRYEWFTKDCSVVTDEEWKLLNKRDES